MLAWHYTPGLNFRAIIDDGKLRPTDMYIAAGERPVLWFSFDQEWEPTAAKAWQDESGPRLLTRWETWERGGGLFRFGVDQSRVIRWPLLAQHARMPARAVQALNAQGIKQGAIPSLWAGTLAPVERRDWVRVDLWEVEPGQHPQTGRWVPLIEPAP